MLLQASLRSRNLGKHRAQDRTPNEVALLDRAAFSVLAYIALGRLLRENDDGRQFRKASCLSFAYCRARFGEDPSILKRKRRQRRAVRRGRRAARVRRHTAGIAARVSP